MPAYLITHVVRNKRSSQYGHARVQAPDPETAIARTLEDDPRRELVAVGHPDGQVTHARPWKSYRMLRLAPKRFRRSWRPDAPVDASIANIGAD